MLSIFDELLSRVEQGERFNIDFELRNLKIGKEFLIKDGKWDKRRILYPELIFNPEPVLEKFYQEYKYSCPSKRSESNRRTYFKALSINELSDEHLIYGENREYARAKLECFVLCMILRDKLKWNNPEFWFWKSENDPDLILLRKWVEG